MSWDDWEAYFEFERSGYIFEEDKDEPVIKPVHLYLVDGDNHINSAIKRIKMADETDDVRIFVSQEGLYQKLIKKNSKRQTIRYPLKYAADLAARFTTFIW